MAALFAIHWSAETRANWMEVSMDKNRMLQKQACKGMFIVCNLVIAINCWSIIFSIKTNKRTNHCFEEIQIDN